MFKPCRESLQVLGDECRQPQAFIQLAHQKEVPASEVTRDPWNATFRKRIERELKRPRAVIHPQGVTLRGGVPYV